MKILPALASALRRPETADAVDLLERSLPRLGREKVSWSKHDSDLDPIRNHLRYQKIMETIEGM